MPRPTRPATGKPARATRAAPTRPAGFDAALAALRARLTAFDAHARSERAAALRALSRRALRVDRRLVDYDAALIFLAAPPAGAAERRAVERELARVARALREAGPDRVAALEIAGLPHARAAARYSHDCVRWLLSHPRCRVALDSVGEGRLTLNEVLALTLPSLERAETTAGLDADALFEALDVRVPNRLAFLVAQLAHFDGQPLVKDRLFDALDVYVDIVPRGRALSRAYSRLAGARPFVHTGLIRRFDHRALLDEPLPAPTATRDPERATALDTVRQAMLLSERETDPATYAEASSFRLYRLGRGNAVAIFGMVPERQLPLESYVGFTLFKNGFAAAYGGAWVFGRRARFGMNVFDTFRGGESGYTMCEVLRTYRQAFGVDHFEVEPYMYGRDNPEGIASGAFWFYYRHGFRPVDPTLAALAARERRRLDRSPGSRSSPRTLERFTACNMALALGAPVGAPDFAAVAERVGAMIRGRFRGDRAAAAQACEQALRERLDGGADLRGLSRRAGEGADASAVSEIVGSPAFPEWALAATALGLDTATRLAHLAAAIRAKPRDVYAYQSHLTALLDAR